MKIGFLIKNFYPFRGGAENNCYYLARELVKSNEVHVFCCGEKDSEEEIEGIKVHRCKKVLELSYYLTFYPSLVDKLLRTKLDIIHCHGFGFVQNDIAIKKYLKKYPKTKIVCTPHGPFMALQRYSFFKRILKKLYFSRVKKAVSLCDVIIKVNPFQDAWMTEEYRINKDKIKFLPNGIPKELFKKRNKKMEELLMNKYDLKGKFVVTYIGRIQRYKGLDQIIKIMPDILKLNKNTVFLALGKDDNEIERLKSMAKKLCVEKQIIFTGEFIDEEKNSFLDLSEIFVFPSEWEAFGIGPLEAMARGNAIVSSKTEGGKYLIKEGENGYLFDYGNSEELLNKLRILMNSKSINKIQKRNIIKSRGFLWNNIAKDLNKIYRELI